MKLRRVVLAGFKSFAERTVIDVGEGIMGIVGPNGCGKSNIVDALRWVMGESRASQLRQDVSADIIFNGTDRRRAADWCSVELLLVNDGSRDIGMWQEYAELSVRRQLERDGESNYFINGQRVRRRDVVDLFSGTGTGARSYGIVEQERVTQIVRAEPQRIRAHLEEAAGVAIYKERRRETENRMEVSEANLARLDDTIRELKRQQAALAKQAELTGRIRKTKKRLQEARDLELVLRHENLASTHAESLVLAQHATDQTSVIKKERDKIEADLVAMRQERQQAATQLNTKQGEHYQALANLERARQELKDHELSQAQDRQMLHEADAAAVEQEAKSEELKHTIADLNSSLTKLKTKSKQAKEAAQQASKERDKAQRRVEIVQNEVQQAEVRLQEAAQAESAAVATAQLVQHRLDDIGRTLSSAGQDLANLAPAEGVDEEALAKLRTTTKQVQEEAVANERQRQELNEEMMAVREELVRLQGQLGGLQAEQTLLQLVSGRLRQKYAGWLQERGLENAKQVVEEAGIVAPGLERALDAALAAYLAGFLVSDLAKLLNEESLPEGLVLVDRNVVDRQRQVGPAKEGLRQLFVHIKVAPKWENMVANWLAGVYLAEDHATALQNLAKLAPGELIVTADGACFQDGVVRAASNQETGVEWNTRLSEVDKKLVATGKEITTAEHEFASLEKQHNKFVNDGEILAAKRYETDAILVVAETEAMRRKHANDYRQEQLQRLQTLQDQATAERKSRSHEEKTAQQAVAKAKDLSSARAMSLQESRARLTQEQEQVDALRETYTTKEAELRDATLTSTHQSQRQQELNERLVEVTIELAKTRTHIVECQARLRSDGAGKLKDAVVRTDKLAQAAQREVTAADDKAQKLESHIADYEAQYAKLRVRLEEEAAELRELELATATKRAETESVKRQLEDRNWDEEQVTALRQSYQDLESVVTLITKLEVRIERAGPVNYAADEEHSACEMRLAEVQGQSNDIREALSSLQDAIKRIDAEMLERIKAVHASLSLSFDKLFKLLFEGGSATIELVGDNLLAAGLQLRATPPGKKVTNIQSLSGGEKTLTAIAFLFALNKFNPPPYCVLDEVDAALDEANTLRFCRLLESMHDQSQFIIITHNKQVIERVNHMIGVTQEEKGVSRLVSVNVDEALAQARAAGGAGG